jgi:hypothetical protein
MDATDATSTDATTKDATTINATTVDAAYIDHKMRLPHITSLEYLNIHVRIP